MHPLQKLCVFPPNDAFYQPLLISGIFFVLPCIENYSKVDLRTSVIDIPPQEVSQSIRAPLRTRSHSFFSDCAHVVRVGDRSTVKVPNGIGLG